MLVIAFDRGDVEAVLVDKGEAEGRKRANEAQVRAAERRRNVSPLPVPERAIAVLRVDEGLRGDFDCGERGEVYACWIWVSLCREVVSSERMS